MSTDTITGLVQSDYKYGFVTEIKTEPVPPGISEEILRHGLRDSAITLSTFCRAPKAQPQDDHLLNSRFLYRLNHQA